MLPSITFSPRSGHHSLASSYLAVEKLEWLGPLGAMR